MRSGCAVQCHSSRIERERERERAERKYSEEACCIHQRLAPNILLISLINMEASVWYLSILLQVVVQDLGVGLLVRSQDVHEGRGGVASPGGGVDGPPAAQGRGQAEGGGWRASVETLLLKRLKDGRKPC